MGTDAEPAPEDLPAPAPSGVSPDTVRDWRWQLTPGEDRSTPPRGPGRCRRRTGIAPRVRVGRSKWFNLLWLLPIGFVVLIVAVAVAQGPAQDARRSSGSSPATRAPVLGPRQGGHRVPGWVRCAALLQPVLDDLHHPVRGADPERPSAAVLDPAQHAGQGLVPGPEAGARPSRCGPRSRTRSACRDRSVCPGSGTPSGWPAGGISASTSCGCSTGSSSTCLLFVHRAVAASGADQLGACSPTRCRC